MITVPDKTIAFFPVTPEDGLLPFDMDISTFLKPLNKDHKRHWFSSHFYHCLPLSIGNMQGFVFYSPFDFSIFWNGGDNTDDLIITIDNIDEKYTKTNHVSVKSEFGHGIFTFHLPVILRTPPKVNLMTIAPPNYPTPGISPMTGVVETDNLRFSFTLNVKVDIPNTKIEIKKNYPIVGILPVQRYFSDSFSLVNAYDIFSQEEIDEEKRIVYKNSLFREDNNKNNQKPDRLYYRGMDIELNKFADHQLPRKNK